jgi:hypothetical protein
VATPDPASEPAAAPRPTRIAVPKRGSETALDMVRSLGLIAVVVAVTLIFVPGLIHPGRSDRAQPVDYSDFVSGFHQVTERTALTPASLPAGWRANAGDLTGPKAAEHLHVGFAVPGSEYGGLEESVAPAVTFARSVLGASGAIPIGRVTLGGASWAVSTSSRGEYSLRRTVHGVTVIVTGSATAQQLQTLAASLR